VAVTKICRAEYKLAPALPSLVEFHGARDGGAQIDSCSNDLQQLLPDKSRQELPALQIQAGEYTLSGGLRELRISADNQSRER
jgi:hypothetical protein